MLIVALTGGIATGKSVVAQVLEELGCYVHHADKIAHDLMKPEEPAWRNIVDHFGEKILNSDKTINRLKLGAIVYSDNKERLFLNKVVHPLVFEKKKEIIKSLKKEGRYKIFVSEAALTIEAGLIQFFNKTVVVYCKKEDQIKRLMERDQINRAEALKKLESQKDPKEKMKYADYIIDTSGTLKSTIEQAERVYRNLILDYESMQKKRKSQTKK
ncbi:MAG: dephospho-CoA kinase [Candidatus Aminicenantes bacterium]|nr:MAG: dephospho-CoA kinase [Candidatus Aminicenantes bacterium]